MFCPKCGAENADAAMFCVKCGFGLNLVQQEVKEQSEDGPAKPLPGGIVKRFFAMMLDGVAVTIGAGVIVGIFVPAYRLFLKDPNYNQADPVTVNLLSLAFAWFYYSFLESSKWQATLGKKALGLAVTDLKYNRISFLRATYRHLMKIVSIFTAFIGFIMAGFTEKRQALHDIIAKTLVVRKDSLV